MDVILVVVDEYLSVMPVPFPLVVMDELEIYLSVVAVMVPSRRAQQPSPFILQRWTSHALLDVNRRHVLHFSCALSHSHFPSPWRHWCGHVAVHASASQVQSQAAPRAVLQPVTTPSYDATHSPALPFVASNTVEFGSCRCKRVGEC